MTVVQSVTCDIDGDGNLETVQGMSDSTTVVLRGSGRPGPGLPTFRLGSCP